MDLKELDLVDPYTHWYYQSKLVALKSAVVDSGGVIKRIIDVGAGSGFFSKELATDGTDTSVLCIDPNYNEKELTKNERIEFAREASKDKLENADLFIFMDVLEHVEDDLNLLQSYLERAKGGAIIVVTVPAFMSLWSSHDIYLEHYRRYRLHELENLMSSAGLDVIAGRYLFGSIFPVAWLKRTVFRNNAAESDLKPVPRVLNTGLVALLSLEHKWKKNRLAGLSALVVARVPLQTV